MRWLGALFVLVFLVHCSASKDGVANGRGGSGGLSGSSGSAGAATGGGGNGGSGGTGGSIVVPDAGSCVPVSATETVCDGKDDDCNGKIDDVDIGGDGICDCLRIGIIGSPGTNPSADFQAWLQAKGTTVERTQTTAGEAFDAQLLSKYDVLVLDRLPRQYTATEAAALAAWVESGGGFISMTGYTGNAAPDFYTNTLLAPFGLAYQGGLLNGPVTSFATHPVTKGLTSVTFLGGYMVGDPGAAGVTSTVIASLPAGPVGYAVESGNGRGVVWGDEWIEFDSEWKTIPEIQQLWVNVLAWIGPRNSCAVTTPS